MEKKFYVYEFIRLDTNEPFYVGKGCGNRVNDIHRGRNKWFKNIIASHDTISRIIIDNLDEKEAYEAEVWFIYEYKHILNFLLVNMDDGGYGACSGEANPMYGKKGKASPLYGRKASKERCAKISNALKGKKRSEEHSKNLKEAIKKRDFNKTNNPNYGNGEKVSGGKNYFARKVKVFYPNGATEILGCKKEVCEKFGISSYLLRKLMNKVICVEKDFSRNKDKHRNIEGVKFEEVNEGVTTS